MELAEIYKDRKKFKNFFNDFFPSLVLFSKKYVNNNDTAIDISQEVFIKFWNHSVKIESLEQAKSYLYTMAKNNCLNFLKHKKVEESYYQNQQTTLQDISFKDNIIEQESNSIIYKAIEQLSPQSKKIILLSLKGYKNKEIAEELNISIITVRTLKNRALSKLKKYLNEYFYNILLLLNI